MDWRHGEGDGASADVDDVSCSPVPAICVFDVLTRSNRLGVVYNALPGGFKAPFGEWAKQEYPELWTKLGKRRQRNTMAGPKFDIVRHFEA